MVSLFHNAGYTTLTAAAVAPTMLLITVLSAAVELLPERAEGAEGRLVLPGPSPRLLQPFPLHAVSLIEGTHVARAAATNLRYLLSLRIAIADGEGSMTWMPAAIGCVRHAAACRVPAAREFELLPVWFYVVELVAHENWVSERSRRTEPSVTLRDHL